MQIGRIQGCTRTIGQSQGYIGLPLRDIAINCSVGGPDTPAMETAWLPTPAEIAAINAGAPVILRVLGTQHPPVMIYTGAEPAEASFVLLDVEAEVLRSCCDDNPSGIVAWPMQAWENAASHVCARMIEAGFVTVKMMAGHRGVMVTEAGRKFRAGFPS